MRMGDEQPGGAEDGRHEDHRQRPEQSFHDHPLGGSARGWLAPAGHWELYPKQHRPPRQGFPGALIAIGTYGQRMPGQQHKMAARKNMATRWGVVVRRPAHAGI